MPELDTKQGIGQERDSEQLPIQPGATAGGDFFGRGRQRVIRGLAAAAIVAGSALAALPFFEKPDNQAEAQRFPAPIPTPEHIVKGGMPSQELVKSRESLGEFQIQIEFDIGVDHYMWNFSNGTWGIYPPNDPERVIGTMRVQVNGIWISAKSFQPLVTAELYPEIQDGPGVCIGIGGMAVNIPLDKYYLGTAASRNDGYWDPRFELGSGVATPENYTNRRVIKKGLPQGGRIGLGDSGHVILGSDAQGNYANYMFSDCLDPAENGIYQLRLDSLGNPIGDTFVKLPLNLTFLPLVLK